MATPLNLPDGVFEASQASSWDTKGCTEFDHDDTSYVVAMSLDEAAAEQAILDAGAPVANLDEIQGYKIYWGVKP